MGELPDDMQESLEELTSNPPSAWKKLSDEYLPPFKNRNVKLIFLWTFFGTASYSIWGQTVYSLFIYRISNNSTTVLGFTSGIMGLFHVLFTFPSGYLSDKFNTRDKGLKIAGVVGLIGTVVLFYAIFSEEILFFYIGLSFFGLFNGLSNPIFESIFADSLIPSSRTSIFTLKQTLLQLALSFGPFLVVFLFLIFGNHWKVSILRNVMIFGLIPQVISLFFFFFFRDDLRLEKDVKSEKKSDKILSTFGKFKKNFKIPKWGSKWIPFFVVSSDLIIGFGAGMTIRFFPVFFAEFLSIDPVVVNSIYSVATISTAFCYFSTKKLSDKIGRVSAILLVKFFGTFLLFLIGLLSGIIENKSLLAWIISILFILRTALMNSTKAISRAILMDNTHTSSRGFWNSFEGLTMFAWTGSAVIGGILIQKSSFQLCFLLTSGIYLIGSFFFSPLLYLVDKKGISKYKALDENEENEENEFGLELLDNNQIVEKKEFFELEEKKEKKEID